MWVLEKVFLGKAIVDLSWKDKGSEIWFFSFETKKTTFFAKYEIVKFQNPGRVSPFLIPIHKNINHDDNIHSH